MKNFIVSQMVNEYIIDQYAPSSSRPLDNHTGSCALLADFQVFCWPEASKAQTRTCSLVVKEHTHTAVVVSVTRSCCIKI